jgi:hypothetical protein
LLQIRGVSWGSLTLPLPLSLTPPPPLLLLLPPPMILKLSPDSNIRIWSPCKENVSLGSSA